MSRVLITREEDVGNVLIHYRTKGSKNGERLYQYEDGSLTPLGRIHYGVGKAKRATKEELKGFIKKQISRTHAEKAGAKADVYKNRAERAKDQAKEDIERDKNDKAEKNVEKAVKFEELYNKYKDKQARIQERDERRDRSESEIKKDVEGRIEEFNKKTKEAKDARVEKAEEVKKKRDEEIAEIRSLTDEELSYRIDRLQKERTYAELVNQRANYEQSPARAKAAKIFQEFAEQFARKALNKAGDEVLNKLMAKARNGDNDSGSGKSNKDSSGNNPGNNPGGSRLPKNQKGQIKTMAHQGKSVAEIAKSLGLTEDQVKGYMAAAGITINKS